MTPPKVLIADAISQRGVDELCRDGALEAVIKTGLSEKELVDLIPDFSALVVRSQTKVTADILNAGAKLRVVGRAGVGVDNVDVETATRRGIIVLNAPGGNTVSTAEHAFSLLLSAARKIPQADANVRSKNWDKKNFEGVELYNKTLGIIGMGRIGGELSRRAIAFGMRVVAYDPYLSASRARSLQVELVDELDDLLTSADFISLHTPLTAETRNIISAEAIGRMKKGARLINCARGGLVDEVAVKAALESGQLAGAAFDVFEEEPATSNPLFGNEKVVSTPHLGASTSEAQENVALQVAEQISDYLLSGAVTNALNMPSISAGEAQKVRPWIALAEHLGAFAGQLTDSSIAAVEIVYEGTPAGLNTRAMTQAAISGLLKPALSEVNMVNAPVIAKERGIRISEVRRDQDNLGSFLTVR